MNEKVVIEKIESIIFDYEMGLLDVQHIILRLKCLIGEIKQ